MEYQTVTVKLPSRLLIGDGSKHAIAQKLVESAFKFALEDGRARFSKADKRAILALPTHEQLAALKALYNAQGVYPDDHVANNTLRQWRFQANRKKQSSDKE